jgi:phenylacetate-coenzyme A ligase PaaK-like adenylate-forming protein
VILGCGFISHYQLVVTRNDDRDELNLKAELKDETVDREKLSNDLSTQFHNTCHVRLDRIDFLIHGTLPERYQRILDERL